MLIKNINTENNSTRNLFSKELREWSKQVKSGRPSNWRFEAFSVQTKLQWTVPVTGAYGLNKKEIKIKLNTACSKETLSQI